MALNLGKLFGRGGHSVVTDNKDPDGFVELDGAKAGFAGPKPQSPGSQIGAGFVSDDDPDHYGEKLAVREEHFDEADALFGRRTNLGQEHDRLDTAHGQHGIHDIHMNQGNTVQVHNDEHHTVGHDRGFMMNPDGTAMSQGYQSMPDLDANANARTAGGRSGLWDATDKAPHGGAGPAEELRDMEIQLGRGDGPSGEKVQFEDVHLGFNPKELSVDKLAGQFRNEPTPGGDSGYNERTGHGAWREPSEVEYPNLTAAKNEVSIESLELAHEGLNAQASSEAHGHPGGPRPGFMDYTDDAADTQRHGFRPNPTGDGTTQHLAGGNLDAYGGNAGSPVVEPGSHTRPHNDRAWLPEKEDEVLAGSNHEDPPPLQHILQAREAGSGLATGVFDDTDGSESVQRHGAPPHAHHAGTADGFRPNPTGDGTTQHAVEFESHTQPPADGFFLPEVGDEVLTAAHNPSGHGPRHGLKYETEVTDYKDENADGDFDDGNEGSRRAGFKSLSGMDSETELVGRHGGGAGRVKWDGPDFDAGQAPGAAPQAPGVIAKFGGHGGFPTGAGQGAHDPHGVRAVGELMENQVIQDGKLTDAEYLHAGAHYRDADGPSHLLGASGGGTQQTESMTLNFTELIDNPDDADDGDGDVDLDGLDGDFDAPN